MKKLYRRSFFKLGVVNNPDLIQWKEVGRSRKNSLKHRYNGYIHLKSIPGASRELVNEAGLYADRVSVNIEIPNEESLKILAPEKDFKSVFTPMRYIQQGILQSAEEKKDSAMHPVLPRQDKVHK